MIKYIECYINVHKPKNEEEVLEMPKDIEDKLYSALVYSAIWGIGGCLDENTRSRFDVFLQEVINGDNVIDKYELDFDKHIDTLKIPAKIGD